MRLLHKGYSICPGRSVWPPSHLTLIHMGTSVGEGVPFHCITESIMFHWGVGALKFVV